MKFVSHQFRAGGGSGCTVAAPQAVRPADGELDGGWAGHMPSSRGIKIIIIYSLTDSLAFTMPFLLLLHNSACFIKKD
jgi:hypothetical protein